MKQPGKLIHRITIQRPVETQDSLGATVQSWQNLANVWASIEPLSAREQFNLHSTYTAATHKIGMHYIAGVTAKCRVLFGTRAFDIESVINPEERNEDLNLVCSEVQ
jgi:SPP1 family predicted phage head-tail adaptor